MQIALSTKREASKRAPKLKAMAEDLLIKEIFSLNCTIRHLICFKDD